MFETEPIVAANLQTGRRRTGMGSMQVISPDTTFALGSHSFVVAALGTGQRPSTGNKTPTLDYLRLQQGERLVINHMNYRIISKTDTHISIRIHVLRTESFGAQKQCVL